MLKYTVYAFYAELFQWRDRKTLQLYTKVSYKLIRIGLSDVLVLYIHIFIYAYTHNKYICMYKRIHAYFIAIWSAECNYI